MKKLFVSFCVLFLPFGAAHAAIVNGGFETGLAGWSTLWGSSPSKVHIMASASNSSGTYMPTEGSNMLDLKSSFPWTVVYQNFTAEADSNLSFDWNFLKSSGLFSLGYAGMWIGSPSDFLLPTVLASTFSTATGWNTFSQGVAAGPNTIAFFSNNILPIGKSSQFLIDNVRLTPATPVPEPNTGILLFSGLLVFGALSYKKMIPAIN